MHFTRFKVGTRLTLGFIIVFVFLAAVVSVGFWNLQTIGNMSDNVVNQVMAKERLIRAWSAATQLNGARTVTIVESVDPQVQKAMQTAIRATSEQISALQKQLDGFTKSAEEAKSFEAVAVIRKQYAEVREKLMHEKNVSDDGARLMVKTDFQPVLDAYLGAINNLVIHQGQVISDSANSVKAQFKLAQWTLLGLGLIAIVCGLIAGFLITRGLKRELGCEPAEAAAIANSIAAGNLAVGISLAPNDRSSLLYAISAMRDQLATVVAKIRAGADTIATASGEIAAGNLDLSSRTEQQASSLEQTAAAMEQLTATVKQNADSAHQASDLADAACAVATEGGAAVTRVVDTMLSINQSARRIVDIISVIDGIAFQTNILALNAAVEAARAGEQGRGFAVVASEVRSLAQRSAAAAREIKVLINDSVEKVDAGSAMVNHAGDTIGDTVTSVKRVNDIVEEISQASKQQSTGIAEVNEAIVQMDSVTQQNAALVEQAAAAAASLQEQARQLAEVVSIFTLNPAEAPRTLPGRQPAAAARSSLAGSLSTRDITPRPVIGYR